jgi:hypothetical protein
MNRACVARDPPPPPFSGTNAVECNGPDLDMPEDGAVGRT